jgi:hypothetical protein
MISDVNKIGYWSAIATTLFAIIYIIPQLIIGIDMPESKQDLIYILAPSLFLALSFIIMMTAVHYQTSEDKKIWSHLGLLFTLAYFVFVTIVYFTVLTVTMPHMLRGEVDKVEILRYIPKSFMTGIDALGYTCMSLSTLFASKAFSKLGTENRIRIVFFTNGVIAPIILLTQIYPNMAYAGAIWIVTMPLSSFLVALHFKNRLRKNLNEKI